MITSGFPFHAFAEPERSLRSVHKLHEMFISSGAIHLVEDFSRALASSLKHVPDPDRGVTNLLRFVEATLSTSSLFNDLLSYPMLMEVVMQTLSSSQYFADILVRDPELFRWLTASDALVHPRTKAFLRAEADRAMRVFQKPERKLDSLRRLYRREILRIGVRDVLGEADLATVTQELSHLADVLVDASCHIAHQQLSARYPQSPNTPYTVIGLGKLGGSELNYSSDIDIIFVYKDEGELEDARGVARTYHEYFNAFVEKVVQNLSERSAEGHLYRVDMRLRPEGKMSPLARSLQSYLLYYESRGELWERQMLLKARPVAGDIAFGEEFIRQIEPFVYPRTLFQNPKDYIARIKARIEAALVGEENVKLRAGGIRDIEFIVQALQLINGGKNRAIRSANTLEAIRQLAAAALLSDNEQQKLTDAYVFFRTLEHRLQTMLNTQTYELPDDVRERRILARKLGFSATAELERRNHTLLTDVRRIFDTVLSVETTPSASDLLGVIDGQLPTATSERILREYGFVDVRKAARNITTLISGTSLFESRDLDNRARDAFREIAGTLFDDIAQTPVPDETMHNLALLASAQKLPDLFYKQLKEASFRKLVLTVCATSRRFSKGLASNPLLLEALSTDPQALTGSALVSPLPTQSLIELKNQEELRAGIRYILGIATFDQFTTELSQLADTIVATAVQDVFANARIKTMPLAIFALGKYGTREITIDSDLDLLFVGNARTISAQDALEKAARDIVKSLTTITKEGKLYDVDARLRPEGKSAPLVVDKVAYLAYLAHRASLWERQSLTRLRFVAGNAALGVAVVKDVQKFVYEAPFPKNWVDEIVKMRRKTETRARVTGSTLHDVKLSAGGMMDIEFLAQIIQLKFGKQQPILRHLRTSDVFSHASPLVGSLQHRIAEVVPTYRLYRRIETCLRVTLEERGNVLPEGPKLDLLARVIDRTCGEELRRTLTTKAKEIRQLLLTAAKELAE